MKGTVPIITCDDEYGCDEWAVDNYETGASNWREVMAGWQFDPRRDDLPHLCPKHAQSGDPCSRQAPEPGHEDEGYSCSTHNMPWGECQSGVPKHAATCPDHHPVQHRDARPPWCNTCGLTAGGAIPTGPLDRERRRREMTQSGDPESGVDHE